IVTSRAQSAPHHDQTKDEHIGDTQVVERLLCLNDSQQCDEFLRSHPALISTEAVSFLTERVRQEVRSDTAKAVRIAATASSIARRLGNPDALAHSFRAR